ncbi:TPA: hypothetical protein DEX28_01685 [Patescibacteria group bacterium]|uniref:Chromosome partition protein Smc n=1 Tax=Candidatus Woesebacteria bacterium GW2011_GWB1_44_11b TaxID=1618580 RepID=A0A0G1GIA6_9BACT|nr:MAG: Chromosome partition protein Smc [Candidatus Woesebacteria bacterium GW2011_GWB1_44_11b]KKT86421.1 MAG: Chromosome partition protein Smc [Parcubacteria group bacterium GW2011_GWA1_Parcubacteria_45_10]HCI05434.1 hypothetical protein [Patescibacteria group bacterium]
MLKQLEIQGFKSFSDKTVLNFPEGITAVVGPNGSGKSNVVDAIRWVFGEQSSKNIRINSAEDVIFSGTPQKQASSSSQVSLLFDNRFKTFPLDFEEVEIRRKVYRDGASEYFLNKKQVRLKDLVQLLASAKLGLKGMSIINQGAADVFLRANSVERREMIEEMVGLKELRLKKEEAERKIKDSKLNLAQAETILNEIGPNLRSLKRQVERWRTRQEKEAELLVLEKDFFIKKIAELLKETNLSQDGKDEEKIKELENEINREQSSLKNFNQGATGHSGDRQKIQAKLESLQKQRFEILRTLGNLEGQLELLGSLPETELNFSLNDAKQKLEQVLETLESVLSSEEISSIKEKIAALTKSLKSFLTGSESRSHKESESKKQSLLDKKTELAQALDELEEKIVQEKQALADEEKEKNQSFASLIASLENKRKEMRVLEEKVLVSKVERERFKLRQEDLSLRLEEAGLSWDVFVKDNQARLEQAKSFGEDLGPFEKKILRLKNELSLIGEVDQETLKEYETISARFEFLSSQKSDLESALEDLEELSKSLEEKIVSGFEEALKKIDKEFQKYFGIIFDGGRAALKVEKVVDDQTQAVNFGIEISINLPRKKIKSLEMLSGGERSLTAVALLFAVINYARPPFLVLDEADAALDESNSRKLAKVLLELAKNRVQFILITHNRAVMESADVLYGITMSDGISKVFSLKFKEAEEIAKKDVHSEATAS